MLFNSGTFLASFCALAVLYYALPHRFRWPLLLAASLGFYALFAPLAIVLLAVVTLITYGAAIGIDEADTDRKRKTLLRTSIAVLVIVLASSKLSSLFVRVFATSVGVSFYTLSCISYLADVHARRLPAERHVGHLTLFIAFFPKLLAGPIERAAPLLAQLRRPVAFSDAGVTSGLQLMMWGLFKKAVIADRIAPFVDHAYTRVAFAPPADLLLAAYLFPFQLYCDFSGYSDIAIGVAKVLGIDLVENFRRPHLSTSVREFWARRWHLSLTSWFRDYIYIPLGGHRVSFPRLAANVLVVFLLSGAWHGANWTYVVWGGLNGVLVVGSMAVQQVRRRLGNAGSSSTSRAIVRAILTFHLLVIPWIFFRAASVSDAFVIVSRIATAASRLPQLLSIRLKDGDILLMLAAIAVLLAIECLDEARPIRERLDLAPVYLRWCAYYGVLFSLIVLGVWNLQQFVYMQF